MVEERRGKAFSLYLDTGLHQEAMRAASGSGMSLSEMVAGLLSDRLGRTKVNVTNIPVSKMDSLKESVLSLISEAAALRVLDIHVRVDSHEGKIHMRIDGVMQKRRLIEAHVAHDMCMAAFEMADASNSAYSITEYQSARILSEKASLPKGVKSVRLQFNPLPDGGRMMAFRLIYDADKPLSSPLVLHGVSECIRGEFGKAKPGLFVVSAIHREVATQVMQSCLLSAYVNSACEQIAVISNGDEMNLAALHVRIEQGHQYKEDQLVHQALMGVLETRPDVLVLDLERRNMNKIVEAITAEAFGGTQVWMTLRARNIQAVPDRLLDMGFQERHISDSDFLRFVATQHTFRNRIQPTNEEDEEKSKKDVIWTYAVPAGWSNQTLHGQRKEPLPFPTMLLPILESGDITPDEANAAGWATGGE